jgi:hypothetical protein
MKRFVFISLLLLTALVTTVAASPPPGFDAQQYSIVHPAVTADLQIVIADQLYVLQIFGALPPLPVVRIVYCDCVALACDIGLILPEYNLAEFPPGTNSCLFSQNIKTYLDNTTAVDQTVCANARTWVIDIG